jgi:LytS/YehU family sensor histidine kinase
MIPPLTLQMLIENAIKHNLITDARPLTIEVGASETHLLVRNSLFAKPNDPSENHGSGLKNIEQRYAHFTDLKVEIRKTESYFEVHIPLLEVGYY